LGFSLQRWRRARIVRRAPLEEALWRETLARYRFLTGLSDPERERLRELVTVFLHDKQIHGAAGLELDDAMRMALAVQACILLLALPDNWYDGWVEIIVYPDEFVPEVEWEDEFGVVHTGKEIRSGEAWLHGPVILSWADIGEDFADGINVAIHEFAHKIDMLNGDADGFPPLHADMDRSAWTRAFSAAYEDFCHSVDAGRETTIDPYAAESPGEFFAVLSEAFIERPEIVHDGYPEVYRQLKAFYRQDPYARHAAAGFFPVA
jgi:Mlc titration factor MtfA (ptsG expression regulator)